MVSRSKHRVITTLLPLAVALILACGSTAGPASAPGVDPTTAALQFQGTALALQLTQVAMGAQSQVQPVNPPVAAATANAPAAPPAAAGAAPTAGPAPTVDIEARIKSATCVSFDDMDAVTPESLMPETALQALGIRCKNEGSYSGHFFADLGSGTKYDLIIAAAEDHRAITGEFWDAINTRVTRDKAALVVEMWYLDREARGPISKILSACGLAFMKNSRLDQISWWEPTNEIFNMPNAVPSIVYWNQFWMGNAPDEHGNKVTLGPGGDAILLAGQQFNPSNDAVLATCGGGRQVWQFFTSHDYPLAQMMLLWQNYIHYALKNHFLATTP